LGEREYRGPRMGALSQRGYTLLEWVITVAVVAMVILAGGAFANSRHAYATHSAVLRVGALLTTARALAATSGNGATLTFITTPTSTVVTLYAGRPNGGTFGTVVTSDTLEGGVTSVAVPAATTAMALFVDSAGTGTASTWMLASGTLAAEPACPGALDLIFTAGGATETHALSCSDMILQ